MGLKAQEIADAIYEHLKKDVDGNNFSKFYIGITNDIERRLFGEHNVPKEQGAAWWIIKEAINKNTAQKVEEHFLNRGMQGDTGGGTDDSVWVYCYKITNKTRE